MHVDFEQCRMNGQIYIYIKIGKDPEFENNTDLLNLLLERPLARRIGHQRTLAI